MTVSLKFIIMYLAAVCNCKAQRKKKTVFVLNNFKAKDGGGAGRGITLVGRVAQPSTFTRKIQGPVQATGEK